MPSPDVILTIWDDPRNVDTLVRLHGEGKSFAQIAAAIPGSTRNAVIGKAKRMKLPAREEGKHSHRGEEPFRAPGRVDVDDDGGVDVSHLIAFADRKIGRECAWIPGDPLNGAMCCGKPVKEGSQWCPEHHARVYSGRAEL